MKGNFAWTRSFIWWMAKCCLRTGLPNPFLPYLNVKEITCSQWIQATWLQRWYKVWILEGLQYFMQGYGCIYLSRPKSIVSSPKLYPLAYYSLYKEPLMHIFLSVIVLLYFSIWFTFYISCFYQLFVSFVICFQCCGGSLFFYNDLSLIRVIDD